MTNTYTGIKDKHISLGGTKTWVDGNDKYGKRNLENGPNLPLKVYRLIEGQMNAYEDITDLVDVNWSYPQGGDWNSDRWNYTITPKNESEGGKVGLNNAGTQADSLYRYAPNGKPYLYFVGEKPGHHYDPAGVTGTVVTPPLSGSLDDTYFTLQGKADAATGNVTASFENTLNAVSVDVTKLWKKDEDGNVVAMDSSEYAMMLPDTVTFAVEYQDGNNWHPLVDKNNDPVTVDLTKQEIIKNKKAKVEVGGLPRFIDARATDRDYRLVETAIDGQNIVNNEAAGFKVENNNGGILSGTVTNTLITKPLTIKKKFDDSNNTDGVRPTSIKFTLKRDDVDGKTITTSLSDGDTEWANWESTGVTLYVPAYQTDGMDSTYAVTEESILYYSLTNASNAGVDAWTITAPNVSEEPNVYLFENKHELGLMNVKATKAWDDKAATTVLGSDGTKSTRPDKIMFTIQQRVVDADGNEETPWADFTLPTISSEQQDATVTLEPKGTGNTWDGTETAEWKNLPCRTNIANGAPNGLRYYQYRVVENWDTGTEKEVPVTGYQAPKSDPTAVWEKGVIAGGTPVNKAIKITNKLDTTELTVNKVWADEGSNFTIKDSVEVQLYYRLKPKDESDPAWTASSVKKVITSNMSWQHKFTGLPKMNNDGVEYEYKVIETKINDVTYINNNSSFNPSYSEVVDNKMTVTNTLVKRENIVVEKDWDDNDNQDGIRPTVEIVLYKDKGTGEEKSFSKALESKTVDGTEKYFAEFDNLPKYRKDGTTECEYTVGEKLSYDTSKDLPPVEQRYKVSFKNKGEANFTEITGNISNLITDQVASQTDPSVTLRNSYTPQTMNLKVVKTWSDLANWQDYRPGSLQVKLYSMTNENGPDRTQVGKPVTIKSTVEDTVPAWTHTWSDLPVMNGGKRIFYSVEELQVDGSAVPVPGYDAPSYGLTKSDTENKDAFLNAEKTALGGNLKNGNAFLYTSRIKNTQPTVSVKVIKNWENDAGVEDLYRPETLTFTVQSRIEGSESEFADVKYNSGEKTGQIATMSIAKVVTATTQEASLALPKLDRNGKELEYRVIESKFDNTSVAYDVDNNTASGKLNGKYEVSGLERYTFTSSTEAVNGGYETTVTNKLTPERIDLSGTKTWDDFTDKYKNRPETIEIELYYKDGTNDLEWKKIEVGDDPTKYDEKADISWPTNDGERTDNTWNYYVKNLLKFSPGKDVARIYGVKEVDVPIAYTFVPSNDDSGYAKGSVGIDDNITAVNFTNKLKTRDITVKKVWNDNNDQDGVRPKSITVELTNDGGVNDTVGSKNITITDPALAGEFKTLPVYQNRSESPIEYKVKERSVEKYATTYEPASKDDGGLVTDENEITITNSYTPKTMKLAVTKVWEDEDNKFGQRPENIKVQLYKQKGETPPQAVKSELITISEGADGKWTYTFSNLPIKDGGEDVYYSIIELNSNGDSAPIIGYGNPAYNYRVADGSSGQIDDEGIKGDIDDKGTMTHQATITNTQTTIPVKVIKNWDDKNNAFNARPKELIFTVQRVVSGEWQNVSVTESGKTKNLTLRISDTSENGKEAAVNVPKVDSTGRAYEYRIVESAYRLTSGSGDVETSAAAPTGYFKYDHAIGTGGDQTTHKINYSYSTETAGSSAEGYTSTVTNALTEEMISLTGTKTWSDSSNTYNSRPADVEIKVYRKNNTDTWSGVTLSEGQLTWTKPEDSDQWSYKITELPRYSSEAGPSDPWQYAVAETVPPNYSWSASKKVDGLNAGEKYAAGTVKPNGDIENVNFTNTLQTRNDITVKKLWNDMGNQDGLRKDVKAKVRLIASIDGTSKLTWGPQSISVDDDWSHKWDSLPLKDSEGVPYVYTISEVIDDASPYQVTYRLGEPMENGDWADVSPAIGNDATSVITVRNSYTPKVMDVQVEKTWDDEEVDATFEDESIVQPSKVVVTLQRRYNGSGWENVPAQDGWVYTATVELNQQGSWSHDWTGLPCRVNVGGTVYKYDYQVVETAVPGYTTECTPKTVNEGSSNKTIKVTNTLETTSLPVEKTWDDKGSEFANTNHSATVQLTYKLEGEAQWLDTKHSLTLTKDNDGKWKGTFTNLPKKDVNGKDIQYSVRETAIDGNPADAATFPHSYQPTVSGNNTKATIANELATRPDITLTKVWDDDNNRDGIRENVGATLVLIKDDDTVEKSESTPIIVTSDDGKTYTWSNLPLYRADGKTKSTYSVKEILPDGSLYSVSYSKDGKNWSTELPVLTSGESAVTVKNSYKPKTMELHLTKTWGDADNKMETRPEDLTFTLMQTTDPEKLSSPTKAGKLKITKDSWTGTWKNLPVMERVGEESKPIYYFVVEQHVEGYQDPKTTYTKAKDSKGSVASSNAIAGHIDDPDKTQHGVAVFNPQLTTQMTVTKYWDHGTIFSQVPNSVTIKLQYSKDEGKTWTDAPDEHPPVVLDGSEVPSWTATFEELPTKDSSNKTYQYRAVETKINDTVLDGDKQALGYQAGDYVLQDGETLVGTITNTLINRAPITVTKEWDDDNNRDGIRPTHVKVKLTQIDGDKTAEEILDANNDWSYSWDNLPKYKPNGDLWKYTVEEIKTDTDDEIDQYKTEYSVNNSAYSETAPTITDEVAADITVKNSYEPKAMALTVTKDWQDKQINTIFDTTDFVRPGTVKVTLQRRYNNGDWKDVPAIDGKDGSEAVELNRDNWSHTWRGLPSQENDNGHIYTYDYRVVEKTIPGYETSYSQDSINENSSDKTIKVTNTLKTTSLPVEKTWDHKDSKFTSIDHEVTVQLMYRQKGDKDWKPAKLSTDFQKNGDKWEAIFVDLPETDVNGDEIQYSVRETAIDGKAADDDTFPYSYKPEVTGDNSQATIKNVLETREDIKVTKLWDDDDDRDGLRKDVGAKLVLIKDAGNQEEEIVSAEEEVSTNDGKSYTWTNLPLYQADGKTECTYTVKEILPEGSLYSVSYSTDGENWSAELPVLTSEQQEVTVKNSYGPKTMNLEVNKDWDDQEDLYGYRPEMVKVQLYSTTNPDGQSNAQPVFAEVIELKADTWTHTWSNLPVMDKGKKIYYSVREVEGNTLPTKVTGYQNPVYSYTATGENAVVVGNEAVAGSLADENGTSHRATVKNSLDTVKVAVVKEWKDFGNTYESRPAALIFTLQRRTGWGSFENVEDPAKPGTPLTARIERSTAEPIEETQRASLSGLPKYEKGTNMAYEYRFVESHYQTDTAAMDVTSKPEGQQEKGFFLIGRNRYEFSTDNTAVGDGFETVVTNELQAETISLSGLVYWEDDCDKFKCRPSDVVLTLYYRDDPNGEWIEYEQPLDEVIKWNKDYHEERWSYTIAALPKYTAAGSTTLREYGVKQGCPGDYVWRPGGTLTDIAVGTRSLRDHSYERVNHFNSRNSDASLVVAKEKLREAGVPTGPADSPFAFKVYIARGEITPDNPGILYTGGYEIFNKDSDAGEQRTTADGEIVIVADQKFVIKGLPLGYHYKVEEIAGDDYELHAQENDRGELTAEPTQVKFVNKARSDIVIRNETENKSIDDESKGKDNAGGKVAVVDSSDDPRNSSEDNATNKYQVAFKADPYWYYGESFSVKYTPFGDSKEYILTISNYLDAAGNPLPREAWQIESTEDTAGQSVFPDMNLAWNTSQDALVLTMANDVNDMPRKTEVDVVFDPTLAINNVTAEHVGGMVMVAGGHRDSVADGSPVNNGEVQRPYRARSVFAMPEPGYRLLTDQIGVRNMAQPAPEDPVYLESQEDGSLQAELATTIADKDAVVQVTARLIETRAGRTEVRFDPLPVPIEVDVAFAEIPLEPGPGPAASPTTDPGPAPNPDAPGDPPAAGEGDGEVAGEFNGADTPWTGDDTPLSTLVVITAIAALGVLWLGAKRRQEKKED